MGDKLPENCLISLTDIPPDFEKHLKLVAERVQAMMISVNEYNSDNDEHDGAIFMTCLMDALTSLYCDIEDRPTAGLDLKALTSVFTEGDGSAMALLMKKIDLNESERSGFLNMKNAYACIRVSESINQRGMISDPAVEALLENSDQDIAICEITTSTSAEGEFVSIISRSSILTRNKKARP